MSTTATTADLGAERFVSLTTFRKTAAPVATPVWIGRDGDALIVTTPAQSGKVKRLRHNPRVTVRPSSRTGKVEDDARTAAGSAEIVTDAAERERLTRIFRAKYGLEYRIFMLIERLVSSKQRDRVMLRIRLEE